MTLSHITQDQYNRIKGAFYGQAIGDALGLGTEFLSKVEVEHHYPNGIERYSDIIRDKHRSRFDLGAWTDDTDQFLSILNSILEEGKVSAEGIAKHLKIWFNNKPLGIGSTVLKVITVPGYEKSPFKASKWIWERSKKQNASNGAVMRTSIIGCYEFWNTDNVLSNAETAAKTTHFDPRCVGSCTMISWLISKLILENGTVHYADILAVGDKYDDRIRSFLDDVKEDISSLNLDEPVSIGYTLKTLGAGLWAFQHSNDFESGIQAVIMQGGDADTNAAVAGSVLGCKFGFESIPNHLVKELKNIDYLESALNEFLTLLDNQLKTANQ